MYGGSMQAGRVGRAGQRDHTRDRAERHRHRSAQRRWAVARAALPSSCGVAAAIGALAAAAALAPAAHAQTSTISFTSGTYSQDFNGLPTSGQFTNTASNLWDLTDPALGATNVTGWYVGKTNGTNNALFRASDGVGGIFSGAAYSWGSTNSTDRALGSLASGTTIPNFGAVFVNNSGSTLTQFTLSYTGEQWRLGSGPANTLTFGYNLGGTSILDSGFTNVAALSLT